MKQVFAAVRRVLVPSVMVLGLLGSSSVAMAASRAGSPIADGAADTSKLPSHPHSAAQGLAAGPTATRLTPTVAHSRQIAGRTSSGGHAFSTGHSSSRMGAFRSSTPASRASHSSSVRSSRTR